MKYRIIAKEPGGETSRLFDRLGIEYKYVACECGKDRFNPENTIFYPCKGEHGSNIARKNALKEKDVVVFDDDYSQILYGGMASSNIKSLSYKSKEQIDGVTLTDTQAVLTEVDLSKTATKKRGLPFAHLPKKGGYHTKKRGLPFTLLSLSNIINIIKRKTPFLGGRFLYRLRIIPRYTELTKVRLWQD